MNLRQRPLAGLNIVDLASGPLAAIGRVLAELGADVILVEQTSERGRGLEDRREQIRFAVHNIGKRSIALDVADARDRTQLDAIIARSDILIEDASPQAPMRLDIETVRSRHPELTVLSVSDFGRNNVFSSYRGNECILQALSSALARSGLDGLAPLLPPGELAYACAASQAAFGVLLSYYNRLRTGRGDWLDFSALDGACLALDPGYGIGGSAGQGARLIEIPRGRPSRIPTYPIITCADGKVRICVLSPKQWRGMHKLIGSPAEFDDPKYNSTKTRRESVPLNRAIAEYFATRTCDELEKAGAQFGVPIGALLTMKQAIDTEHMRTRQATIDVPDGFGGSVRVGNGAMLINGERMGPRSGAPGYGDSQASFDGEPLGATLKGPAAAKRPLAGLRVLDLGVIVVGAEQGRLLADQGADVVKVETRAFPDGSRLTLKDEPISVGFAAGHRNKRSIGLNLRDPEGRALFLRLAEKADIILTNFKPGTMDSLGLGYDVIRKLNPGIIMLDSSAFGSTGPWSRRMGYGPLVRANVGVSDMWRYPDEAEGFCDSITIYPDHTSARCGLIGVLALLIARLRHGHGGTVSIAQAEVILSQMANEMAQLSEQLDIDTPSDAPWGVYPCAGDDEWCVVTVRDDADWRALKGVTGWSGLLTGKLLESRAGRLQHKATIETALKTWLAARSAVEAMETLQGAGVPAAAMFRPQDFEKHPYFAQRSLVRTETHPLIAEPFLVERGPVASRELPDPPARPAPLAGEHTQEVMRDWLGLSSSEIDNLVSARVLETLDNAVPAE